MRNSVRYLFIVILSYLTISHAIRGGSDSPKFSIKNSVVVNLLSPEERLLRKKIEEENSRLAASKYSDSNRTRMYKEGVRQLARYFVVSISLFRM